MNRDLLVYAYADLKQVDARTQFNNSEKYRYIFATEAVCSMCCRIHQHTNNKKHYLKTCINETDIVTCIIAIECVCCIVPTETSICRINYKYFPL